MAKHIIRLFFLSVYLVGCGSEESSITAAVPLSQNNQTVTNAEFVWQLPSNIAPPSVPEDNPMSNEKVTLGRFLFYDKQLSANASQACADCHQQDKTFSDGQVTAIGSTGIVHPRNSQALVNTAFNHSLTWNNPDVTSIEQQIVIPLFGSSPVEMGLSEQNKNSVLARFQESPSYISLFNKAFPDESAPVNFKNIVKSIAVFIRTMNGYNSAFDRFQQGEKNALSPSAQRGMALFLSERLACTQCHSGINFNQPSDTVILIGNNNIFQNIGLFNVDNQGGYPLGNQGLIEFTHLKEDMGKFRIPSLRNIELSAPYMHDGSVATLDDVLDVYSAGGRFVATGEKAGDGRINPFKNVAIKGFSLAEQDKKDMISFLNSLTDKEFINNAAFSNPSLSSQK